MKFTKQKIEEIAEGLGWNVSWNVQGSEKYATFAQYSPAGEDFSFDVWYENLNEIGSCVRNYWENYDPAEEAMAWLGPDGHGQNGAPYEMEDLLNDKKEIESMLESLGDALVDGKVVKAASADPIIGECLRLMSENFSDISKEMFVERVEDVCALIMKNKSKTAVAKAASLEEVAKALSENKTLPAMRLEGGKGDYAAARRIIDKNVERCDKVVFDGYAETVRLYADGKKLEPEKLLKLAARALDGLGTAEQMMVSRRLMALGADSERKTALVLEREIFGRKEKAVRRERGGMER